MNALAVKKGQTREKDAGLREMGTLRCDSCGEEFVMYESLGNDGSRVRRQRVLSESRRSVSSISISNITDATRSSTIDG